MVYNIKTLSSLPGSAPPGALFWFCIHPFKREMDLRECGQKEGDRTGRRLQLESEAQ